MAAYYHLNDPTLLRYWDRLTGLFHRGFGTTVSTDVSGTVPPRLEHAGPPIGPAVWKATAITCELVGTALVLVIVGTIAARKRRFRSDVSLRVLV